VPRPPGGARHQGRELAVKTLFQLESSAGEPAEVLAYHAAEDDAAPAAAEFAEQLVRGVLANRDRLDEVISSTSEHWRLDQMAKVDRIILRIAIYEISLQREVPEKAAINEAIELAKTFSGDEAGRFVNGILGRVAAGT
jgi:transcription antitermination protein NusB